MDTISVALLTTKLTELSSIYQVVDIASEVIQNTNFLLWSGSPHSSLHHYGKHGLLIHTYEVVRLCMDSAATLGLQKEIDLKWMFLAALYHDIGKLDDYRPINDEMTEWESTDHKKKIYHIVKSYEVWNRMAEKHRISRKDADEVSHAILAHHGRLEWKSPVEPQTKMAWILHLCDNMSARVCDNYGR